MGSYNVACSISNISINCGDPVVYFPLEPAKYRYHVGDGNSYLISPHCFYAPATLPLFGIYGDYGRIEDIEQNENMRIIESHFGARISKVTDITTDSAVVAPISSGMFVHRKIFDAVVKCAQIDDLGKRRSPIFGSKEYEKDPYRSLRHELYSYREKVRGAYADEKRFAALMASRPKRTFKSVLRGIKVRIRLRNVMPIWSKYKTPQDYDPTATIYSIFAFREFGVFNDIYRTTIMHGGLEKEIIQFALFTCGIGAVNCIYFPTANGYQFGNPWACKRLHWTALKIDMWSVILPKFQWMGWRHIKWAVWYDIRRFKKGCKKWWKKCIPK